MKKTITVVLLALFILTLLTACGDNKSHYDTGSSASSNDCCESTITKNDCCSADNNSSGKSSETKNADDSTVPDCCG